LSVIGIMLLFDISCLLFVMGYLSRVIRIGQNKKHKFRAETIGKQCINIGYSLFLRFGVISLILLVDVICIRKSHSGRANC
jgi:hypothetical protein